MKTHMSSVFFSGREDAHAMLLNRIVLCLARVARVRRSATSGIGSSAKATQCAKTLVFLSRCSNPVTVFAIPAGTGRYRHSLIG
jgi:hypothetical protein